MLATWPMTLLAVDAKGHAAPIEPVRRRWGPIEEACMTFQAARNDGLVKMRRAIGISGTIDPTVQFCPVTYRQFKKFGALPKQVSLSLPTRADHHIDALCVGDRFGRRELLDGTFEVAIFRCGHFKRQIRIGGVQYV